MWAHISGEVALDRRWRRLFNAMKLAMEPITAKHAQISPFHQPKFARFRLCPGFNIYLGHVHAAAAYKYSCLSSSHATGCTKPRRHNEINRSTRALRFWNNWQSFIAHIFSCEFIALLERKLIILDWLLFCSIIWHLRNYILLHKQLGIS